MKCSCVHSTNWAVTLKTPVCESKSVCENKGDRVRERERGGNEREREREGGGRGGKREREGKREICDEIWLFVQHELGGYPKNSCVREQKCVSENHSVIGSRSSRHE